MKAGVEILGTVNPLCLSPTSAIKLWFSSNAVFSCSN